VGMDEHELLFQGFLEDEESTRNERLERLREFNNIIGPTGDMLLQGGIQSQLAIHEVANSYVCGNYMAVILLSQAFIEHSLSGHFMMAGEDKIAESSFKKIIDKALETEHITNELYESLNKLRLIRNPYVHAKVGLKNGSLTRRMMFEKFDYAEDMAKSDALKAIHILKEFKDQHVFMWFDEIQT